MRATRLMLMGMILCGLTQAADDAVAQMAGGGAKGAIQTTNNISLRGSHGGNAGLFIPPAEDLASGFDKSSWHPEADARMRRSWKIPTAGLTVSAPEKPPASPPVTEKKQEKQASSRRGVAQATASTGAAAATFPWRPWAVAGLALGGFGAALLSVLFWIRAGRSRRPRASAPAILAAGFLEPQRRGDAQPAASTPLTQESLPARRAA